MTILERLLGHDAWTTRQLLLRCRELSDEQLDRKFDIGDRSLRETFVHMLECNELHLDRILGRPERELPEDYTVEALLKRQRATAKQLADLALRTEREGRLDELWGEVKLTLGAGIVHVITHSMHHRAQAMFIMEQLRLKDVIEGDALGWESVARGWGWADGRSCGRPVSEWDY
jgi:uncharacterized damage-inducible protein DinB